MSQLSLPLAPTTSSSLTDQIHANIIKSNPHLPKLLSTTTTTTKDHHHHHHHHQSIILYSHMLSQYSNKHSQCLQFSLPSLLKSCAVLEEGLQIHAQILKTTHFQLDPYISNALLRMYLEVGELVCAKRVFDTTAARRDAISWNSFVSGCVKAGDIELALAVFQEMPGKDVVSFNSILDGLMKASSRYYCDVARDLFRSMPAAAVREDVITWTVMISGYLGNARPKEALDTFRMMLASGVHPDAAAIVNVLSAIARLGFARQGKWVHAYLRRTNVELNSEALGSALVDMYAKCGLIHDAYRVFASVRYRRRTGDWNSMISGFALHGLGREALKVFEEMERLAIDPDEITFLGILNACSHSGLVEEGRYYFELMKEKLRIEPRVQHYGCLIDLLGRAGLIEEATRVVAEMRPSVQPDAMVWKSLLSSCVKHGDWVTGERAAVNAIGLAPQDSSSYVLLSNMYAKLGRWQDVDRVRALMRARGVRKIPGCSALMMSGKVHEFLVGKGIDSGCSRGVILSKLEEVICRLKSEGSYEADLSQVLVDVEESEKEELLSVHSEKMAIAFGLVNVEKGAPIHIVKNLRVCSDCHSFTQLVSRVYKQEIVLRDQNRFHHFKGGSCSCNGYW